jgi:hypothetical protein
LSAPAGSAKPTRVTSSIGSDLISNSMPRDGRSQPACYCCCCCCCCCRCCGCSSRGGVLLVLFKVKRAPPGWRCALRLPRPAQLALARHTHSNIYLPSRCTPAAPCAHAEAPTYQRQNPDPPGRLLVAGSGRRGRVTIIIIIIISQDAGPFSRAPSTRSGRQRHWWAAHGYTDARAGARRQVQSAAG